MKPTDEQKAILKADGRVVRINARAGTGKTTTLSLLAKKHSDKRILYLVFNRKAREEAKKTFPANTGVFTVHALAFRKEGYKWKESIGHFSPADLLAAFKPEEQILATLSYDFLVYFLNSPYPRLEDAVRPFRAHLSESMWELFEYHQGRIIHTSRSLATAWNTGQRPCPHDFYLKLFHKSGKFYKELARYDIILIDEAQDLSPIMLDALRHCQKRIFLVGDSHQQVYSFRYAIDAMQKLSCEEDLELTLSFRFGRAIAELATLFIQEAKQEQKFSIQGSRKKSSAVSFFHKTPTSSNAKKTAVLSRSNVGLFENAMYLRTRGTPFGFEKDIYPLLMKTLDVYWLDRQRKDKVRDPLIKSFRDVESLEEYAKEIGNFSLLGMVQIADTYADEFPDAIFEMAELTKGQRGATEKEGIILSTIHSAKGQEYEQVYIDRDMAENLDVALRNESEYTGDEINVAYVGFTRAMQRLYLPYEFMELLTPKWKTVLEDLQQTSKPSTSKKKTVPTRQAEFSPGDYVQTVFGAGVILEISGEYCLIDLVKDDTKLRERVSNLRHHSADRVYKLKKYG